MSQAEQTMSLIANRLQPTIQRPQYRLSFLLVGVWLLTMIAVPILRWTYGDQAVIDTLPITVSAQIAAVTAALWGAWGFKRTLIVLMIVPMIAWLSEFVGHNTGFPFGAYFYTERLQPQLGDVPIVVPLAWLMMLPPAWAVARLLVGERASRFRFAVVTALVFTAWDLFLDPQMVAWDLWRWIDPGAVNYFGIPLVNFGGWLLVSFTMTYIASLLTGLHDLPLFPLLTIYLLTWALQTIGQIVFWGLPGSGIVGGVTMGACLWLALRTEMRRRRSQP
jgi:putative membrane protein